MRIEAFNDASQMPEKYLPSLVDAEIECWGSEPFSEYRICLNEKCRAIYSIEDVYGSLDNFWAKKSEENDFSCKECNESTSFVYEKGEFLKLLIDEFKKNVSLILALSDNNTVRGFGIVTNTTVLNLINTEFNTRLDSYNKKYLNELISKKVFFCKDSSSEKVTCFHHIFVGKELRKQGYGKKISYSMIELLKFSRNTPVFLETRKESNGYFFSKSMGFDELITDQNLYTIMYLGKCNDSYSAIINNLSSKRDLLL